MATKIVKASLVMTLVLVIAGAFYFQSNRHAASGGAENGTARTYIEAPVTDGKHAAGAQVATAQSSPPAARLKQTLPGSSRYDTSTSDSLSSLAHNLVGSKDIADVEYALHALQTRCVSFGASTENATQWLRQQPPLRFLGKTIGNDAERLVAIEKLHKKCGEIASNPSFDAQIQIARVRLRTERTPTQQFIGVTRGITAGTTSQAELNGAMKNILTEPALGYMAGFSDQFADYLNVDSVLRPQATVTPDDLFLVRKATLDITLCYLGEDCSPNGLHFLLSCAKFGACAGGDVSEAYQSLYAKAGLDRAAFSDFILSTVSDIKRGGNQLIANALSVKR